ncbi:hypothetical protein KJ605_01860, partial [Patescibacteria group bacterium]|nr:hypothetical protein [Patescibacteria group bacterium]
MKSNRHNLLTALVLILLFLLSFQLMFATFRYDPHKGYLEPATKVWSDFTVNLHLIRSFSLGANLDRFMHGQQVEYPVFPGEPIKYHYLFYMAVGVLERLGLRIDWALNVPSALGFFLLSGMVYFLAARLFKKRWVAVLSVIFFVFNGSFAFIDFFKAHPLSLSTPQEIFNNQLFWGLAPWGKGTIASSMWNLNIYTNQRHLPLAFGLVLLFMFSAHYLEGKPWRKQLPYALLWGLGLGIFPYFHQPALLIMGVIVVCYWLTLPALRKYLTVIGIIGGLVILPQLFGLKHGDSPVNWYPGFILPRPLSVSSFLVYWWQNFGLHSVLIPFGFLLADRKVKKYLLPLFVVFILAYLVTFSPDPATNHKFFNYSLILGGMLSAFVVVSFVESIKSYRSLWLTMAGLASLGLLLLLLTLSGIIDYFAVINDYSIPIPDAEA